MRVLNVLASRRERRREAVAVLVFGYPEIVYTLLLYITHEVGQMLVAKEEKPSIRVLLGFLAR